MLKKCQYNKHIYMEIVFYKTITSINLHAEP